MRFYHLLKKIPQVKIIRAPSDSKLIVKLFSDKILEILVYYIQQLDIIFSFDVVIKERMTVDKMKRSEEEDLGGTNPSSLVQLTCFVVRGPTNHQ